MDITNFISRLLQHFNLPSFWEPYYVRACSNVRVDLSILKLPLLLNQLKSHPSVSVVELLNALPSLYLDSLDATILKGDFEFLLQIIKSVDVHTLQLNDLRTPSPELLDLVRSIPTELFPSEPLPFELAALPRKELHEVMFSCLQKAFRDHVFVSSRDIHCRANEFAKYSVCNNGTKSPETDREIVRISSGSLCFKQTQTSEVSVLLSVPLDSSDNPINSYLSIDLLTRSNLVVQREVNVDAAEFRLFSSSYSLYFSALDRRLCISCQRRNSNQYTLILRGAFRQIFDTETCLNKMLHQTIRWGWGSESHQGALADDQLQVIRPWFRALENQFAVEINIDTHEESIRISGRLNHIQNALECVSKGYCFFKTTFSPYRWHTAPFAITDSAVCSRINEICLPLDIEMPQVSRIAKMKQCARLLVSKHNCFLFGGFVRDWVICGNHDDDSRPNQTPRLTYEQISADHFRPKIADFAAVPNDLDLSQPPCGISEHEVIRDLKLLNMTCRVVHRGFMISLIVDEDSGNPFQADLVYYWATTFNATTCCQDIVDVDVNMFGVSRFNASCLVLRCPVEGMSQSNINSIVSRCKTWQFQVIDHSVPHERIHKLLRRGWSETPSPLDARAYPELVSKLIPLKDIPNEYNQYCRLKLRRFKISNDPNAFQLHSVTIIRNDWLRESFESIKHALKCEETTVVYTLRNEELICPLKAEEFIDHCGFDPSILVSSQCHQNPNSISFQSFISSDVSHLPANIEFTTIYICRAAFGKKFVSETDAEPLSYQQVRIPKALPRGYDSTCISFCNAAFKKWNVYRHGQVIPLCKIVFRNAK